MSRPVGYLLDTNVISESSKRHPSESVLAFIDQTAPKLLYISVLTLGELRRGAKRKEPANAELTRWIDTLERRFAQRTLPVTRQIAQLWGELSASRSLPVVDTLLAATALIHNLTLVTRNTRDVQDTGVQLLNPWT
ncbi:MAG: type II toxin-antitoxin system VapC family toxin [Acidobacteriaceae bacterium]